MTSDTNEPEKNPKDSMNQPIDEKDEMTEKVVHCSISFTLFFLYRILKDIG